MGVIAYHVILSCYGFWLPNDERGSWSEFVRAYELARFGPATKVTTRRSVAHRPFDRDRRRAMKAALARMPVRLAGEQARAVARGFAAYVESVQLPVYACAILPDHVHMVVGRTGRLIETIAERIKAAATAQLSSESLHPFADQPYRDGRLPTPWARKGWWVYIDSREHLTEAIRYVRRNPTASGLPAQRWWFETPYGEAGALRAAR